MHAADAARMLEHTEVDRHWQKLRTALRNNIVGTTASAIGIRAGMQPRSNNLANVKFSII